MLMFERADAFVALPGGVGTLEELVEQMTWAQLGRHQKPVLLANIDGFWDPLIALARRRCARERFIRSEHGRLLPRRRSARRTSCRCCSAPSPSAREPELEETAAAEPLSRM